MIAARILQGQKSGRSGEEGKLFFESFPHASLIKVCFMSLFFIVDMIM